MNFPSEIEQYFKEKKVGITMRPGTNKRRFKDIRSFMEFIESEKKTWNDFPHDQREYPIRKICDHALEILRESTVEFSKQGNWQQKIDAAISKFNHNDYISSSSQFGKFLISAKTVDQGAANFAYRYATNKPLQTSPNAPISRQMIKGVFQAYLRLDLDGIIEQKQKTAQEHLDEILNESDSLTSDFRQKYSDMLIQLEKEYNDSSGKLNDSTEQFTVAQKSWQDGFQAEAKKFYDEETEKLAKLEVLYNEKLKLEAPVRYWKRMRLSFQKTGRKWRAWAIGTSITAIIFLTSVLYCLPGVLKSDAFNASVVRATIILAIIVSIFLYFIRLFVKLSISAYHLARDAEEREQLTYVYLAMLNRDDAVGDAKEIVLQSIFSRSDTGLLKDGAPAMPSTIETLLKNLKGGS